MATFTYNYNDLGLLGGRTTPSRSVESFTYDLHGWPKSYSASSYSGGTIFSESLRYASPQKSGSFGLWSGMVSEYQSQLYGGSVRTYDYFYDNASRLSNTAHYNGSALLSTNTEKDITYDLNGNIAALKRYGTSLDDNLTFTYNGNRLSSVSDAVGGVSYTYTHDADGNLASDSRKGISVAYNVLGLPRTVTSGTTVLSHYEYLPDGTKLSALAGSGAGYKYRGSFVYSVDSSGNERLESVACDEGRISVTYNSSGTASYRDDWHVRDYLGNTRLVVNITSASTPPSTGILEESDYLPFGTRVATSSTPLNRWRQSGKEEQVIGGNDLGVLDFGARHYDPWLARWTTQDPMAGKYTSLTPYSYCANNSVNLVDPNGKEWRDKNNTITVSLNLTNSAGINISLLDQYKNEISMYFNEVITTASRGKYSGEVIFYENNREIEQTLDLGTFNDNSIGGSTTRMFSIVNVHNKEGELLSVTSLAQSAVHELFHTLRLDHPFEMTQTKDTELIRIGINTYISTKNTDPQIINNIMNYPNIIIDGQKGSTMNLLTPGQFNFIRKEIQLQEMGYGLIKGSYLKHYEKYWNNWPGTRVGSL